MPPDLTRSQVLTHRWSAQQLDPSGAATPASSDVLDIGVQDTGPDGAPWALAVRGLDVTERPDDRALVWSVRGAPHAYRRADLPDVVRALVPLSEADAAKRIYDAAKPLAAAGIEISAALSAVSRAMRGIVVEPVVKGEVSTRMTAAMSEPYLRYCRACRATHMWEMPFRLGAMHAGMELEPGTSPPVLRPLPDWADEHLDLPALVATPPGDRGLPARLDPVLAYLHLLGPARTADVAAYLDAPVRDVAARVTDLVADGRVVDVTVEGQRRVMLASDIEGATAARGARRPTAARVVRLLGPFDLFLQARDRDLLVPDRSRHPSLWPVLGRPGAVVVDGEVVGTWRPRASGARLRVAVDPWEPWDRGLDHDVDEQISRLAAFRGLTAAGRD